MFYEIIIETDELDDGSPAWFASFPAFPEITSTAETKELCLSSAIGAIEEAMAGRIVDGEDIELPAKQMRSGKLYVEVPLLTALKVSLYNVTREKQITRAQLCNRLGWHREQVDRLFRLDHNSRIDQIEAAFKAVGKPLSFEVLEAA
jgi:antitoxin HicB